MAIADLMGEHSLHVIRAAIARLEEMGIIEKQKHLGNGQDTSQQEIQQVLQQLREMPCTPQFRLNGEIQRTVKRYWANVPGAMAQAPSVADRVFEGSTADLERYQVTGGCVCVCL